MTDHTTAQMMRELAITFPTLPMRPLRDFAKRYCHSEGIWTYGDGQTMPGGDPFFCDYADEGYESGVHEALVAWLDRRGWSVDRYDGGTFFLVPNSYFDEPVGPPLPPAMFRHLVEQHRL